MKADYEKPIIIIEEYELNTSIAAGCTTKITLGPEDYTDESGVFHTICQEYNQGTYDASSFWDDSTCSCYLSAGESTLMTS